MITDINLDHFYELAECIAMGIDDDILISVTPVRMNGKRMYWGLDLAAEMGDQIAINQRYWIEKAYSSKSKNKGVSHENN